MPHDYIRLRNGPYFDGRYISNMQEHMTHKSVVITIKMALGIHSGKGGP